MKVVFIEDVPNVAKAGDVKEVADGYGRNYLLPRKLAVLATASELKNLEGRLKAITRKQAILEKEAQALADVISSKTVSFKVKAGPEGRLYGSVTSADIAAEVEKLVEKEIDKRKVELPDPIRDLGTYQVPIKLTKDVTAEIKVVVEAEPEKPESEKPEKAGKAAKADKNEELTEKADKAG